MSQLETPYWRLCQTFLTVVAKLVTKYVSSTAPVPLVF